jgi:hypothetical protein
MPKNGNKKTVKLTPDMMNSDPNAMEVKPDPSAIPNLDKLLVKIQDLLQDIETQLKPDLSSDEKEEIETRLYRKYNNQIPIKIISLMFEEQRYENLDRLLDMFDKLKEVQSGKADIKTAQDKFNEKLNEDYVYPKFGGSKESFEQKIKEMNEKEKGK